MSAAANTNPRAHRVPVMRRQEAMALATSVALQGWKRHPRRGQFPEYYSRQLPDGELNVVEGMTRLSGYKLQYVTDRGEVVRLGSKRTGTLSDAKVAAVLAAARKGIRIVNQGRIENLAPARTKWISGAIKHPGKLSSLAKRLGFEKKPFMKRSFAEQKKILDACVAEYGYRSCLGSTMLLRNFPQISRDAKMRARATKLKDYLVSRYGGPGSFGPRRRNPADGKWEAVPAILMYVDLRGLRLTATQISQLTMETA